MSGFGVVVSQCLFYFVVLSFLLVLRLCFLSLSKQKADSLLLITVTAISQLAWSVVQLQLLRVQDTRRALSFTPLAQELWTAGKGEVFRHG